MSGLSARTPVRRAALATLLSGAIAGAALPVLAPNAASAATAGADGATANGTAAATAAGGRFIVTFRESATAAEVAAARERAVSAGSEVLYDYNSALTGFAAILSKAAYGDLVSDPAVAGVEADEVISIDATDRSPTSGLDRIDERKRPLDGKFSYGATGSGVTAYVIDTGVLASHDEFGGRVQAGRSFVGGAANTDCGEGHGTHVAGLIGGRNYGVARDVNLVPVRVFGCAGDASVSVVIAGIEWMIEDFRARGVPAVANLSAGVSASRGAGLDKAAQQAIDAGITFVTAAGNTPGGDSACDQSPARVSDSITVGAVDAADRRASFSNYGRCVDLFAPGVGVKSAGISSNGAVAYKDGTSMAAPYVAGVAAAFLQNSRKARPSAVRSAIVGASTRDVLRSIGGSSPNRLLFSDVPSGNKEPDVDDVTVSLPGPGRTIGTSTVPVKVRWKGKDPDGEIVAYRLQVSYNGGKSWTSVALPKPTARKATVNVRPDSKLRFRVRATDDVGERSSNAKSATMRLVIDQQSDGAFRSRWTRVSGDELSGDSSRRSSKKNAAVTYRFRGSKIRWIGTTNSDGGKAKVYLDGKYVGTVDTYSSSREVRQVLFSDSVKRGKHTLKIVVTGKNNSRSDGDRVDVDAFVVLD